MRKYLVGIIRLVMIAAIVGLSVYSSSLVDSSKKGLAMGAYKKVLTDKMEFFSTDDDKKMLLSEFFAEYYTIHSKVNMAMIDLDGDGINEIILERHSDNGIREILRYDKGIVYGYRIFFRGIRQIKTDGSFEYSNDAAALLGYSKLSFSGEKYEIIELAASEGLDDGTTKYTIGEDVVSKEEFWAFANNHYKKENVEWYALPKNKNSAPEWLDKYDFDMLKYEGIDVMAFLERECSESNVFNKEINDIFDVTISRYDCNFTKNDINYNDDLLVIIRIDFYNFSSTIICAYEGYRDDCDILKYKLIFSDYSSLSSFRLLDLNGDYVQEIVYEEALFAERLVHILTRKGNTFEEIFEEGLFFCYEYYYDNNYSFVKGASDWYDIVLSCVVYDHPIMFDTQHEYDRGETLFTYNGTKYVPVGEPFEYKQEDVPPYQPKEVG